MSDIKVDSITDLAGTGAPDFPQGLTVSGAPTGQYIRKEETGGLGSETGRLPLNNVPQGKYRVTVGARVFIAGSNGNSYIIPKLNGSNITLGGDSWTIGFQEIGGLSGDPNAAFGGSCTLIVDFPNVTNSFSLDTVVSGGSSEVDKAYYVLERLADASEITTEWN